ncbi:MAG TPA: histidine phosphatase family protein [Pyrinomonadaceae bacterium]|jgi:phosphohistidine phosphatase SixA
MDQTPEPTTRTRTIFVFSLLALVFAAVVLFGYFATFARPVTTVIVVRHAEKNIQSDNPDPDLSPAGQVRAQEIAREFAESGIQAIYATQYRRTQQTVAPLANRLGLPITSIDAKQSEELTRRILSSNRGQTVFVAGHNNTVPEIVNLLSGEKFPLIPESEYDNMFIVTIYRFGKAKVLRIKYGAASTQGIGSGTMIK